MTYYRNDDKDKQIRAMLLKGMRTKEIVEALHVGAMRVTKMRRVIEAEAQMEGKQNPLVKKCHERYQNDKRAIELMFQNPNLETQVKTWAGAFRKLAEFCKLCGYYDAYEFAQKIAKAKGMSL